MTVDRMHAEQTFDEPWQARLFAITEGVIQRGTVDREDFRQHLIASIDAVPGRPSWESWLAALETTLGDVVPT